MEETKESYPAPVAAPGSGVEKTPVSAAVTPHRAGKLQTAGNLPSVLGCSSPFLFSGQVEVRSFTLTDAGARLYVACTTTRNCATAWADAVVAKNLQVRNVHVGATISIGNAYVSKTVSKDSKFKDCLNMNLAPHPKGKGGYADIAVVQGQRTNLVPLTGLTGAMADCKDKTYSFYGKVLRVWEENDFHYLFLTNKKVVVEKWAWW